MLRHHLPDVLNFIRETGDFSNPVAMDVASDADADVFDAEDELRMPGITLSSPPQARPGTATSQQTLSPYRGGQGMSRATSHQGPTVSPRYGGTTMARASSAQGSSYAPGRRGENVRMRTPPAREGAAGQSGPSPKATQPNT